MSRVHGGIVACVTLLIVVAACGGGRTIDLDPAPPNLPPLPDYPVEVCGWANDPAAVDCFDRALDEGRGAELFSRNVTVEGDPVFEIARARPDGAIEMYDDSSSDRFGARGEAFRIRTCEAEDFKIVGGGFFSTGECGPASFGW